MPEAQPFKVTPDQITRLDSANLVELLRRLLCAEAREAGIPMAGASVPLQITVPDGGEDGRIWWEGGFDQTNYLPRRRVSFQAKATNVTEASLKAETWTPTSRPRRGPTKKLTPSPQLRPVIEWVLANGGAYIVITTEALTERQKIPLVKAIEDGVTATGISPSAIALAIYDANKLADWASHHQAVALWVNEHLGGQSLSGFKSLTTWARLQDFRIVPWVDDDAPRLMISPLTLPVAERKVADKNSWTFTQARRAVVDHLAGVGRAVRIVGASGIGKSRLAHALVHPDGDIVASIQSASVIYADLSVIGDEVLRLAQRYADESLDVLLIVDECPDADHEKLIECVTQDKSLLRLITIDVISTVVASPTVLVVDVEAAGGSLIDAIIEGTAQSLPPTVKSYVRDIAQGFPRLAVHGIKAAREGGNPIRNARELVNRIVWGRSEPQSEATRAIEVLSLFEAVRVSGDDPTDLSIIAPALAEMTETRMREQLQRFVERGIVLEKGRYAQVLPIPLAVHLGQRRLKTLQARGVINFFESAPEHLRLRLLDRLKWLDTSPEAQEFAIALLAQENLGNVDALNTEFGSRCFDRLVHVVPDDAISTLGRTVGSLSSDELKDFGSGRRHIVWALEKLVFRKTTFERAARILLNLAIAETETKIANSATGIFKGLFKLYLSGTEAAPDTRIRILDDALASGDARACRIAMEAAGEMLKTDYFTHFGNSGTIGSQSPLEDWKPATFGDAWAFHIAGLQRLQTIAVSDNPNAADAQAIVAENIRGLLSHIPFDDLAAPVRRIAAHIGTWKEGIRAINHWIYFDRGKGAPNDTARKIEALYSEVMPGDPVDCLLLFASGWQSDLYNPEHNYGTDGGGGKLDFEYTNRQITSLAAAASNNEEQRERLLDRSAGEILHSGYILGKALAEHVPSPEALFDQTLQRLEAKSSAGDLRFLKGLISGIETRDAQAARRAVDKALDSSILQRHAVDILQGLSLSAADLPRFTSQLRAGNIDPAWCAHISYGRGLDGIDADELVELLDELIAHGPAGCWSALEIVSMFLHNRADLPILLAERLTTILKVEDLLSAAKARTRDAHLFKSEIERLLKHGLVDRDLAIALSRQLLNVLDLDHRFRFDFEHYSDEILSAILAAQPEAVWQEIAPQLDDREPRTKWALEGLLGRNRADRSGAGVLFKLPENIYLDWVRQNPKQRATIVAQWLPIIRMPADNGLAWHPALERFVGEFGEIEGILPTIGARFFPSGWSGSLVPHLEPWLPLLDGWRNHPLQKVRHWAEDAHQGLVKQIARERRDDEEQHIW